MSYSIFFVSVLSKYGAVKKKRAKKSNLKSKPEPPEIGTQLDLFNSFDGDTGRCAS
ncbi:hypothetical protein NIES4071_55900 [Calothrix sp. NIES-4071]|nr:hypothetical protein NIES4071_55900 [Calothrix sp. NIES-4071]BAZ59897.1 hypothetical protein NIES4105_55850 [Calothrix sp. NIES-4105]